jgi:metallo-beta-lactamase class B
MGLKGLMRQVVRIGMVVGLAAVAMGQSALKPDPPNPCDDCAAWNALQAPFRLFGNTYYVGVKGLSALLVTSDEGHILLDGALPQSADPIEQNLLTLGFRLRQIKVIANSHAHFDHAGGIAALQRASGATVVASAAGAKALEAGMPTADDPQIGFGPKFHAFPPVSSVKVVADREVVRVGPLAVTAHYTPGHTPGSTTWTWQSCEGTRCLNMVYADSLTAVSAPGFRFTGDANTPSRIDAFRESIARIEQLPCDIMLSTHPSFSDVEGKLRRRAGQPASDPFIDPKACRAYAATARTRLDARIAEEGR